VDHSLRKVNAGLDIPQDHRRRRVLDHLHGLFAAPAMPSDLLPGLLAAFDACGGGIAAPLVGTPRPQLRCPATATAPLPWELRPDLLAPLLRRPPAAARLSQGTLHYLLAPLGSGRLLWLEAAADRPWTAGDEPTALLAGQVLEPLLPVTAAPTASAGLDQARLHQRLLDAGTISGRIAHAFDNILTGILGFAELTLSQTESSSPNRVLLEEVLRASQQGVQLTQQLHFFSRCAVPTVGPAPLAYVIEEEEARVRAGLPAGVQLNVDVPGDLPAVAIDAQLLRQVLGHLLDNAREALERGGTITLSARRLEVTPALAADLLGEPTVGPAVAVTVVNTGGEISPDVRRRLFQEPFYSTKPRHRGLGLAIVYRIVQAHHGGVRLLSVPGATTATLVLPVAPA